MWFNRPTIDSIANRIARVTLSRKIIHRQRRSTIYFNVYNPRSKTWSMDFARRASESSIRKTKVIPHFVSKKEKVVYQNFHFRPLGNF